VYIIGPFESTHNFLKQFVAAFLHNLRNPPMHNYLTTSAVYRGEKEGSNCAIMGLSRFSHKLDLYSHNQNVLLIYYTEEKSSPPAVWNVVGARRSERAG
jgi:hypothetical protein